MDENEPAVVVTEETNEAVDTAQPESTEAEPVVEKPKAEKPKRTPEEELEHLLGRVKRLQKDLGRTVESVKESPKPNTGESDIEDLLLEVKGIQDPEQVALFEKWKSDTGRNARQILSNETFQKELATLKATQAVKDATPSNTKRSGAGAENLDTALAKYEQTGELPGDFDLRSAVVNALEARVNASRPSWRK